MNLQDVIPSNPHLKKFEEIAPDTYFCSDAIAFLKDDLVGFQIMRSDNKKTHASLGCVIPKDDLAQKVEVYDFDSINKPLFDPYETLYYFLMRPIPGRDDVLDLQKTKNALKAIKDEEHIFSHMGAFATNYAQTLFATTLLNKARSVLTSALTLTPTKRIKGTYFIETDIHDFINLKPYGPRLVKHYQITKTVDHTFRKISL